MLDVMSGWVLDELELMDVSDTAVLVLEELLKLLKELFEELLDELVEELLVSATVLLVDIPAVLDDEVDEDDVLLEEEDDVLLEEFDDELEEDCDDRLKEEDEVELLVSPA